MIRLMTDWNFMAAIILAGVFLLWNLELAATLLNLKAFPSKVPPMLDGLMDAEKLDKARDYLRVNARFGILQSTVSLVVLLVFWSLGGFGWLDGLARSFTGSRGELVEERHDERRREIGEHELECGEQAPGPEPGVCDISEDPQDARGEGQAERGGEVGGEVPDEGDVGATGAGGRGQLGVVGGLGDVVVTQGEGRAQGLFALGDVEREGVGEGVAAVEGGRGELEDVVEEGVEVGEGRGGAGFAGDGRLGAQVAQALLGVRGGAAHALVVDEHGDRDDEAVDRLDEAEPGLVEAAVGLGHAGSGGIWSAGWSLPWRRSSRAMKGARRSR